MAEGLEQVFLKIDWTNRESILPLIPILELIYRFTPHTMLHVPRKLDEALARDGYRMKDGKLVRLK